MLSILGGGCEVGGVVPRAARRVAEPHVLPRALEQQAPWRRKTFEDEPFGVDFKVFSPFFMRFQGLCEVYLAQRHVERHAPRVPPASRRTREASVAPRAGCVALSNGEIKKARDGSRWGL